MGTHGASRQTAEDPGLSSSQIHDETNMDLLARQMFYNVGLARMKNEPWQSQANNGFLGSPIYGPSSSQRPEGSSVSVHAQGSSGHVDLGFPFEWKPGAMHPQVYHNGLLGSSITAPPSRQTREGSSGTVPPPGALGAYVSDDPHHPTRQQHGQLSRQTNNGLNGSFIDVEALDDDVRMLSTSRGFPQERNRPRRNRPVTIVLDEEPEVKSANQRENAEKSRVESKNTMVPKEPTFSCPICMYPLVNASSTICGHIFCESCITACIQASNNCPICAKELTMHNFHRIYFPSTYW